MSEDHGGVHALPEVVNLYDIILERKAERKLKAEQKRQSDLERIRNMKSKIGIEPIQRFPKEIWAKIFDELDPDDLGNVWQVHPMFRDLLENNRVRDILLPQLMKVDAFQQCLHVQTKSKDDWNKELRPISKSSRKAFDHFMDDMLIEQTTSVEAYPPEYYADSVCLRLNQRNERLAIQKLLASFNGAENSAKRFFPRSIHVSIFPTRFELGAGESVPELVEQYKKDITTLLERIGDQIWHFSFSIYPPESVRFSFSDVYTLFQRWATLMPNLKWLEVDIDSWIRIISEEDDDDSDDEEEPKETFADAQRTLQNHPFPHLTHLERLSFHRCHQSVERGRSLNIYNVVLAANQHIKFLGLTEQDLELDLEEDGIPVPLLPTQLTQSLNITGIFVYDSYHHRLLTSLRHIRPVFNSNWPLKTIRLGLKEESMNSIFQFLNQFPTLETVKLLWLTRLKIGDTGYLKLPNLMDFELDLKGSRIDYKKNIYFFFSLQFLLNCKNMKTLTWMMTNYFEDLTEHLVKQENENRGQMLDFRGGMKSLYYESNIWDVFPSLETVDVTNWKADGRSECTHKFVRTARDKCTSVEQFAKIHGCSRNRKLDSCSMIDADSIMWSSSSSDSD